MQRFMWWALHLCSPYSEGLGAGNTGFQSKISKTFRPDRDLEEFILLRAFHCAFVAIEGELRQVSCPK